MAELLASGNVSIDEGTLRALVGAAESYATDLETGLEDGTYDDRANLDEVQEALEVAAEALEELNLP
jgi:hypothetical protein